MTNVTIAKNVEQPLLERSHITATVEYEAAVPSRKDLLQSVAKKVGVDQTLVVIFQIMPKLGTKTASIDAYAYKNKDALSKIEEKKKLKRTGFAEAPVAKAEGAQ